MLQYLKNLFSKKRSSQMWEGPQGLLFRRPTNGAIADEHSALTIAPLFAAIRTYSLQVGSFPLVTYRRNANGGRELADSHPAYRLLNTRPNPAQSRAVFWQFVLSELMLTGNAYIIIRWRGNGAPYNLYPVPSGSVSRVVVDEEWNKAYEINTGHGPEWYDDSDIIHLVGFSRDGLQGQPLWRYAGESLGLHRQVLEAANSFFANSVRPSIYIKYPGKLDKNAKDNLELWMKENHGGTSNVGRPFHTEGGGEVQQITTGTAEDAQIIEGLGASVGDVGRWTNLSPIQLGDFSAAHYNSLSADNQYLYQKSLRPVLDMIEQELNFKVFRNDGSTFAEFDVDEQLRGSAEQVATIVNMGIQGGWLAPNEGREWMGLERIPGLDTPNKPLNMGGIPNMVNEPTSAPEQGSAA